jgi:hypothetical protein
MALLPSSAAACLCGSPEEGRANANVAFVGVVAAVEDPSFLKGPFTSTGDPLVYTFAVERVLKGSSDEFTVVRSTRLEGSGSCAIDMAIGERWEIYASLWEGDLWSSSCSGSTLLAVGISAPPVPGRLDLVVPIGLVGVGMLTALGVVGVWRRRASSTAP